MRAVVIGSGISGLTAGLMLLRDGHQVWILEQFPTPGGVTAAVSKDGFTWELGQLVLEGLGRDEQLGYVLDELGIYDRLELKRNDRIYSFPDFVIRPPEEYAGPWWRMEKLAELFPEDRTGLEEYCRMYVRFREVVTLARLAERAGGLRGLALKARMYRKLLPLLPRAKWSAERMGAHLFSSEQLQAVFMSILADFVVRPSQFPGLGIPAVNPEPAFDARVPLQVSAVGRQPSYHSIVGGVNALVEVLVDEITSAGGKISTGTEVSRIRVEDGVVKGVTCADGAEIDADLVLASGGAKEVFLDLVGEDSLPEAYVAQIHDVPLMESIFMVHLGVDFDPEALKYARGRGIATQYGDIEDPEFVNTLPVSTARLMVIAVPRLAESLHVIRSLRAAGYTAELVATAYDSDSAKTLREHGVSRVLRPLSDAADEAAARIASDMTEAAQR